MALTAKKVYAILSKKIENGGATDSKIQDAVNDYLTQNPVQPGATAEQAEQIRKNTDALGGISFSITENGILRASWEE